MDSGNSGSLQSSSEAEEECDSLATNKYNNQPHQPAPPLNPHLIFDQNQIINNNNINPFFFTTPNPQQHNQLLNLDSVIWSKTLPSFSDHHFPPATATTVTTEPISQPPPPPRNPRKRSRASRRAPTTVLTTDTNNFRAMVQEFTGIPSPPFTSSSNVFPRLMNSFDLFGRPSPNNNNLDNLPQLPSYLIKPSPSSLLDSSNLLANTMQNTTMFPSSSSIDQSLLFLNPKSTQNIGSSNVFGVMGENQVHGPMPTKTKTRNDDQEIIEPWVSPSD